MLNMTAFFALAIGNVIEPFAIEFAAVKHKHNRFCAKLTVARVAETLSVRAVGGHTAMHIAKLCSDIGFKEPVEIFVIAFKRAGNGAIGMNNVNPYNLDIRINSEIAEAVPGEMGDIFSVCAVGNEFFALIAVFKLDAVPLSGFVIFFGIVCDELSACFFALENGIACDVFANVIELLRALVLEKNGLDGADNLIGR